MKVTRRELLGALGGRLLTAASGGRADAGAGIRTRAIPSSGERIPTVGLGTWQTFDVAPADQTALADRAEVLRRFAAAGGRVVDSSPMYGRAEAAVGELLGRPGAPRGLFLATKVWTSGREQGERQMERSLRLMGGRLDLMQVHNLVDWRTHLPVLRAWKAAGRFRYIGATHYQLGALPELERVVRKERIDFVQLPYSVVTRDAEARLLPAAADSGTAVLVMRPFEEGALFRRVAGRTPPPWASEIDCSSWAQLFLKWILGHPAVTCPIPATGNPRHVDDNMGAGRGRLPDAALRRRIAALLE